MFNNRWTTRDYVMGGIIVVFVLTLFIGNYGVNTYINHERYVIKENLMNDIEDNVERLADTLEKRDEQLMLYKAWLEMQLSSTHAHSILEDARMSAMTFDENLERTYNPELVRDEVGVLMIYDGVLRNMPADLRVEMNVLFEGYQEERFLYTTLTKSGKVILNSSYGYTNIVPYDRNIDGNSREQLVDYYENFNNLSTTELNKWTSEVIPGDKTPYFSKTIALEGGASDRYLCTQITPVSELVHALYSVDKAYELYVLDEKNQLVINNFNAVITENGDSNDLTTVLEDSEELGTFVYPFMKKMDKEYVVGHPIEGSDWKALAVFDASALGKGTLFRTSGFYLINILFIAVFSFLVVVVNKHLTELEK